MPRVKRTERTTQRFVTDSHMRRQQVSSWDFKKRNVPLTVLMKEIKRGLKALKMKDCGYRDFLKIDAFFLFIT
jgi:hypothetical protein